MTVLLATGVGKRWGDTAGLRPVDVRVDPGRLVVVRGRSGSGKSTLLAIFAGWIRPDGGSVTVDGCPPSPDMPWRTLAIVPQVLALSSELSVAENVADGAPDLSADELDAVLRDLRIEQVAYRTIGEISMGQRQRVAVARAVAARPVALLVDEPTSFQDAAHAGDVVAALRAAADRGAAILVATHDPQVIVAGDAVIDLDPA